MCVNREIIFINSINILGAYYVPDTVLGAKDIVMNKTDLKIPILMTI